jgi:hypothetical protein
MPMKKRSKNTRQEHQKKPPFAGKSQRGQGEIYCETKKSTSVGLTPTATRGLDQIAAEMGISRSELVERIGRKILQITVCMPVACPQEVSE